MEKNNGIGICIKGAKENNLKSVTVSFPHDCVIAVTGVSGSGKSSLVFDVLYAESRYRFISHLSGQSRMLFSRLNRPEAESITGLRPALAVDQYTSQPGPRSTVGTVTEIYDYLRLLFARLGRSSVRELKLSRGLFSFNTSQGCCRRCKGLGVVDSIDPGLLISDENKSLREGALVITTPSGYIIYSQVTMDVLNQVCNAEGFHVDIPWKELTAEQKHIVLYGSDKIRIPFGKHTLESRMKWKGITAKPREEGYYRGIIPIMEEILKRDRNDNILRFAKTAVCSGCRGSRLSEEALSVKWDGRTIAEMADFTVEEADRFFSEYKPGPEEKPVYEEIASAIIRRTRLLKKLGLEYLAFSRATTSLSGGEARRLRLATQAASPLQGVLYVLDEPTAGLHPADTEKLIQVLKELCGRGNTVMVVEHNETVIRHADWIADIGPGAGDDGGNLLYSGPVSDYLQSDRICSPTHKMLTGLYENKANPFPSGTGIVRFSGLSNNNVHCAEVTILCNTLNVITGVSGAGKSSLTEAIEEVVSRRSQSHPFGKVVMIDQQPIGRTSRSNPATYTKVFDLIRKLFAKQQESTKRGWKHSDFSFNTGNGRCPACDGAGYIPVGMHFMGSAEIVCDHCHGKRFLPELLEVKYREKNISDVLAMRISEAFEFFAEEPAIHKSLGIMHELGLGYLHLGQNSASLSGGEAQRIKLAAELAAPSGKNCLYLFDEPTTGLHQADVEMLMDTFKRLCYKGHTVLCTGHHPGVISRAGNVIDIGPGSGTNGGRVLYCGALEGLTAENGSVTARFLKRNKEITKIQGSTSAESHIRFHSVFTHNLKNISVSIPRGGITVITGPSGSGKTSLAFDTIYAECYQRYAENWSAFIRSHLPQLPRGDFENCSGTGPAIAVRQEKLSENPRSTVGTYTGVYDLLRLLFSRVASEQSGGAAVYSSLFSFNHHDGACPHCRGLGEVITADPVKLITDPGKSVLEGAMDGTKTGRFYGDRKGQYIATLIAVAGYHGMDFSLSWNHLGEKERNIIMYGTGDLRYKVEWNYARGEREGLYRFEKEWPGLVAHVDEEYGRKHADRRGDALLPLMKSVVCGMCRGSRLRQEALKYRLAGVNIHELAQMEVAVLRKWLKDNEGHKELMPFRQTARAIAERLDVLVELSLGYLSAGRTTNSLSGGEKQRLKLAGILSQSFTGVTFILDEPASGLHPSDRKTIARRLAGLKEEGNTVVIVEHQDDFIAMADHVFALGPGAGQHGGKIVFEGTAPGYMKWKLSENQKQLPSIPHEVPAKTSPERIEITKAHARNLKHFDIEIPLQAIVSITGVSGSGKSTLLRDVLYNTLLSGNPSGCISASGHTNRSVVYCSPSSHGRGGTGMVMTYTGIADLLRKIFASSAAAKEKGYSASHFSVHQPGGRCELCKGNGFIPVTMDFLPDVELPCSECEGKRFLPSVLEVRVGAGNICDFMNMTLNEMSPVLGNMSQKEVVNIKRAMQSLLDAGLGHLVAGQRLSSLSGGEWQRLQLAMALKELKAPAVILLDEPGNGMSLSDIRVLGELFVKLAGEGHAVIFTEHRPELIRYSGWNTDLGIGGGDAGGTLLYCGPTSGLRHCKDSVTAKFL